jgi:hypothetical protein
LPSKCRICLPYGNFEKLPEYGQLFFERQFMCRRRNIES